MLGLYIFQEQSILQKMPIKQNIWKKQQQKWNSEQKFKSYIQFSGTGNAVYGKNLQNNIMIKVWILHHVVAVMVLCIF